AERGEAGRRRVARGGGLAAGPRPAHRAVGGGRAVRGRVGSGPARCGLVRGGPGAAGRGARQGHGGPRQPRRPPPPPGPGATRPSGWRRLGPPARGAAMSSAATIIPGSSAVYELVAERAVESNTAWSLLIAEARSPVRRVNDAPASPCPVPSTDATALA